MKLSFMSHKGTKNNNSLNKDYPLTKYKYKEIYSRPSLSWQISLPPLESNARGFLGVWCYIVEVSCGTAHYPRSSKSAKSSSPSHWRRHTRYIALSRMYTVIYKWPPIKNLLILLLTLTIPYLHSSVSNTIEDLWKKGGTLYVVPYEETLPRLDNTSGTS